MPPRKRGARADVDTNDEGDGFVEDDGGSKKKKKTTTSETSASKPRPSHKKQVDNDGNSFWEMGGRLRRITVSKYRGNTFVGIREHYEKDGKVLAGKKGISLSLEQYNAMLIVLPQIEAELKKYGHSVVRPDYGQASAAEAEAEEEAVEEEAEESEEESKKKRQRKKLSEETVDEDDEE